MSRTNSNIRLFQINTHSDSVTQYDVGLMGWERQRTVWRMTSSQGVSLIGLMLPSPTTATIRTVATGDVARPATSPLGSAGSAGGGPGEQEQATLQPPRQRKVAVWGGESTGDVPGRPRRESWRRQEAAVAEAEAQEGRAVAMAGRGRGRGRGRVAAVAEAGGWASSLRVQGPFFLPGSRAGSLRWKMDGPDKS
jgi:hypothetical protein